MCDCGEFVLVGGGMCVGVFSFGRMGRKMVSV